MFYKKNNLYPSAKSKNEQERYLGEWVLTIRKQFKRGKLLPERKQILDENSFIFNWIEHTFNMKLNKYKDWVLRHKKKPKESSQNQDEKKLAKWYTQEIIRAKDNINEVRKQKIKNLKTFLENFDNKIV